MDSSQVVGTALLLGRAVTSVYLIRVIRVQRVLLRVPAVDETGEPAGEEVLKFRATLHHMTVAILLGQIIPIIIDVVNILKGSSPQWLGFLYAISNVFTAITAAVLIWKLYELAVNVKEVTRLETAHVQRKHDKEMEDGLSNRNKTRS